MAPKLNWILSGRELGPDTEHHHHLQITVSTPTGRKSRTNESKKTRYVRDVARRVNIKGEVEREGGGGGKEMEGRSVGQTPKKSLVEQIRAQGKKEHRGRSVRPSSLMMRRSTLR